MQNVGPISLTQDNAIFLERCNQTCPKNQELRELEENAHNELERCFKNGTIYKTKDGKPAGKVNWFHSYWNKHMKLAVADNGNSMHKEEICKYLGNLGGGAGDKSIDDTFGFGAKGTVSPRNKHGVLFVCFPPNEEPHTALLKKEGNQYVVCLMSWDEYKKTVNLPKSISKSGYIPKIIEEAGHGTMIILLGNSEEENTTHWGEPEYVNHWITQYLNKRYYSIPEYIDVKVYPPDAEVKEYRTVQSVKGLGRLIEKGDDTNLNVKVYAKANGVVNCSAGKIHWAILEKIKHDSHGNSLHIGGGFAVRCGNEIYRYYDGPDGYRILQRYAITHGYSQVVLHAEYDGVVSNITRSDLEINGSPIDIYAMADEFQRKMPKELNDYVQQIHNKDCGKNITSKDERMSFRLSKIFSVFGQSLSNIKFKIKRDNGKFCAFRKHSERQHDDTTEQESEHIKVKTPREYKPVEINGTKSPKGKTITSGLVEPKVTWATPESQPLFNDGDAFCFYTPTESTFYINEKHKMLDDVITQVTKEKQNATRQAVKDKTCEILAQIYFEAHALAQIDGKFEAINDANFLTHLFSMQRFKILEEITKNVGISVGNKIENRQLT